MLIYLSGSRSALAMQQPQRNRLKRIANLRGGIRAWTAKGLPLEQSTPQPLSVGHDPAVVLTPVADCFGDEPTAVALDPAGRYPIHQLGRIPRSVQGDRRVGEPGLQLSGSRITLGSLPVRPGRVYG